MTSCKTSAIQVLSRNSPEPIGFKQIFDNRGVFLAPNRRLGAVREFLFQIKDLTA